MRAFLVVFATALSACSTMEMVETSPMITESAREGGVVKTSVEWNWLDIPIIDDDANLNLAQEACEGWGYSSAQSLGAREESCIIWDDEYGECSRLRAVHTFQCMASEKFVAASTIIPN